MGVALSWFGSRQAFPPNFIAELGRNFGEQEDIILSAIHRSPARKALFEQKEHNAALKVILNKNFPFSTTETTFQTQTPTGWHIVLVQQGIVICHSEELLSRLSVNTEVIACSIEEHVMFSETVFWQNGTRLWSVVHDSTQSHMQVAASGDLPANYPDVMESLMSQEVSKGDCDYLFDVPIELAESVTGFRHDRTLGI